MANGQKDPYEVLGVNKTATQDEIRTAYRKLAKKYHPDFNPGKKEAEQKFKEVSAAYEMVGTPEKREKFDRGEFNQPPPGAGPFHGQGPFYYETQKGGGGRYSFSGMDEDFFESIFGGQARGRRGGGPHFGGGGRQEGAAFAFKGEDTHYQLEINFKDAALGAQKEVTLPNGRKVEVKIPAGIESGKKLRFQGLGGPGINGGPSGDAYVEIHVKESQLFHRKGSDIELEVPVSLTEAVLGGEIKVPTLEGQILLKVPAGSNSGTRLRIKGKGILDNVHQSRGDQYVVLKVVLPPTIDPELASAVRNWSEKHPYDPRKGMFQERS